MVLIMDTRNQDTNYNNNNFAGENLKFDNISKITKLNTL